MKLPRNKPPRWFAPVLVAGASAACGIAALLILSVSA
jgi:hypothetical protein